jgi:flagellin
MVNSINTNASSLLGVNNLQSSSKSLDQTRNQISSGLKVNDARDNAAILSISQILQSDVAGLNSVKSSLDGAIASTDVALAAGDQVSDLLIELKETAVKAADPGLDDASRLALNDTFTALRDQITTIVDSAEFNGTNALKSGGDDITALVGAEGNGNITISAQDLSLGGGNVTLSASQSIATQADAESAVIALEDSIANVSDAISQIGSGSNQLQATKEFTETLQAKTQEGIGNLIDTDLAAASAEFAAGEVRQALGVQSLSISNQQPAILLSLFQQK